MATQSPLLLSGQTSGPKIRGPVPPFREVHPFPDGPGGESSVKRDLAIFVLELAFRSRILLPRGHALPHRCLRTTSSSWAVDSQALSACHHVW